MKQLKTTPLKRWYRVKDNVIYDILTKEPNTNIISDAVSYDSLMLPYLQITYGFIDDSDKLIKINYNEKLYLDSYIEVGDSLIKNKFIPYVNNNESEKEDTSYLQIHLHDYLNVFYKSIINNVSKNDMLETIPFYFKTINESNVFRIPLQTVIVEKQNTNVNCIYKITLKNDTDSIIFDIEKLYDEYVANAINLYTKNIAQQLSEKNNISNKVTFNDILTLNYENIITNEYEITDDDIKDDVKILDLVDISQIYRMKIDNDCKLYEPSYTFNFKDYGVGKHSISFIMNNTFVSAFHFLNGIPTVIKSDWSKCNTSNIINMCNAFSNCDNLKIVDLSDCDMSNENLNFNEMFSECNKLSTIKKTGKHIMSNPNTYSLVFDGLPTNGVVYYSDDNFDFMKSLFMVQLSNWTYTAI